MIVLVTIVHVTACIVLVLTVLLQAGKGADIGAVFGGASTTIFGSSGAGNFLTRLTTGAAIVFMATSLTLTYGSSHHVGGSTIMPESAAAPSRSEPVAGGAAEDDEGAPPAGEEAAPGAAPVAPEAPAPNAPAAP